MMFLYLLLLALFSATTFADPIRRADVVNSIQGFLAVSSGGFVSNTLNSNGELCVTRDNDKLLVSFDPTFQGSQNLQMLVRR